MRVRKKAKRKAERKSVCGDKGGGVRWGEWLVIPWPLLGVSGLPGPVFATRGPISIKGAEYRPGGISLIGGRKRVGVKGLLPYSHARKVEARYYSRSIHR